MNEDKGAIAEGLDLTAVTTGLVRDGMDQREAVRATEMYRQFLATSAQYPHAVLVPTKLVDKAWHAHMALPRQYAADCAALTGDVIDHKPGVYGTAEWLLAYDLTRKLVPYGDLMARDAMATDPMAGAECFRMP
ncbi:hypothetical protein ABMY26_00890 (plasmid) [Azospirillum sp. HJ39]|uniref:hypothetical protein n=1 Tax=Azospirillum sp. HJ39 TaxID=3159496 RepID=UPI00355715CC